MKYTFIIEYIVQLHDSFNINAKMLLQHYPDTQEAIVIILAKSGNLTVEQIHKKHCQYFKDCSLRVIYKHISKLLNQGVLFKIKNRYSLHLTWLTNLDNFADQAIARNNQSALININLPAKGEKLVWKFNKLEKLDRLWTHLGLNIVKNIDCERYYIWHPHPWFHLLSHENEIEYQTALASFPRKDYVIIGGNTYLDREYLKYRTKHVTISMAKSPFHHLRNIHYSSHGPYLITVKIAKKLVSELDDYFKRVKSKSDFNALEARELITQSTSASLTFENNPAKLSKIAKKFKEFFA